VSGVKNCIYILNIKSYEDVGHFKGVGRCGSKKPVFSSVLTFSGVKNCHFELSVSFVKLFSKVV